MTYKDLLSKIQNFTEQQLNQEVVIFDLYKNEGYDDVVLENLMLTFGQD
jgi:hypothetical protein